MTKIDPTPLIAEAQARETALHVACDRIMRAEAELRWWRVMALAAALAAIAGATL